MSQFKRLAAVVAAASPLAMAHAAAFEFSGEITFHNDVVEIAFTLVDDAVDVKVWTDSFAAGANFDPITAVWALPDGHLVDQNDDDSSIDPAQTYFDSGLVFARLPAGDYVVTIATYQNVPAGTNLADGFVYGGQAPIPIALWCQPSSDACANQKGRFWRARLEGVDIASAVPEPATYGLMAIGLMLVGRRAWRAAPVPLRRTRPRARPR